MLGPQFAATESRVVNMLHTLLLEGDFKLFFVLAKVSLGMACLLCISLIKSCTTPQSMPSAAVLASEPCTLQAYVFRRTASRRVPASVCSARSHAFALQLQIPVARFAG